MARRIAPQNERPQPGRIAASHGGDARGAPCSGFVDVVEFLQLALQALLGQDVFPAWMVAAIVARELLVTGLRQAALERGIVIAARDLGKLKTWAQAIAAGLGGFAAAGAWGTGVAWWSMLVAGALTWASGLDYARNAPALFRRRAAA